MSNRSFRTAAEKGRLECIRIGYIQRATHRLAAVDVLFERGSCADVVRESQEVVEQALKLLLRSAIIEVPRVHDGGQILKDGSSRLPASLCPHIKRLAGAGKSLRRDGNSRFTARKI